MQAVRQVDEGVGRHGAVDGEDHVLGGEGRAVMPSDALLQLDGPGQAVLGDADGQRAACRLEAAFGIVAAAIRGQGAGGEAAAGVQRPGAGRRHLEAGIGLRTGGAGDGVGQDGARGRREGTDDDDENVDEDYNGSYNAGYNADYNDDSQQGDYAPYNDGYQ